MKSISKNTARQRESLLRYETVKRWIAGDTIRASRTRYAYLGYLQILLAHFGCNPDELIAQRIEDMAQHDFARRERIEQSVRELKRRVAKEAGETKAFVLVAAACSFFKANTGARLNINNPPPEVKRDVWMYEGEPSREQEFWRNIVDHAPTVRDAALFLIGLEAGPRDGSLLRMTLGDVMSEFTERVSLGESEGGKAPYKIRIPPPGESPMKKRGGYGFIAGDAKAKVECYLALRKARGFSVDLTDPLAVDLDTGKRLRSPNPLNDALRKAFLDASALSHDQVFPPDARMSPVRWYCLRKRAQTIMEDNTDGTGIALNWVDELLSHRKRGAQASHYSKPTIQQLRGAYAKAMHRIMIYREVRREMSDDEFMTKFNKAWAMLGDKMAREVEKIQSQTITGREMARILRELMTISKEAE